MDRLCGLFPSPAKSLQAQVGLAILPFFWAISFFAILGNASISRLSMAANSISISFISNLSIHFKGAQNARFAQPMPMGLSTVRNRVNQIDDMEYHTQTNR